MSVSRPVLTDVARIAGVSAMTVSNVMNGKAGVAEQTRQRVLKAAEEVGYVPNLAARGLARGRTNLVGVITDDLTMQYAWSIMQGITGGLADRGVELLLSATYQDATRELDRVRFLTNGLVDGVILIAPALELPTQELLSARTNSVVVDPRQLDVGLPNITVDHYRGARLAVEHLIEQGHRRIAYIGGDPSFDSAAERHRGYVDALDAAAIVVEPAFHELGDYTQSGGFEAALRLLRAARRPTAIFAAADVSALGAIDAARSLGLDVPADLSVVGFDDIPQARLTYPALTTVHAPLEEMGLASVELLSELVDGNRVEHRTQTLPVHLEIRHTVTAPFE